MNTKTLAAVGLGAVLLYFILKPKTAAAVALPTPAPVGPPAPAPEAAVKPNAPTTETFKDPATGVTLVGPSEPIQAGLPYTVKAGESWSNIAARTYGDFRWWPFLWDANRAANRFVSPDNLAVGAAITIPAKTPVGAAFKATIFARAAAHQAYWKKPAPRGAMPAAVITPTPLP